jgi:hypothetical protein
VPANKASDTKNAASDKAKPGAARAPQERAGDDLAFKEALAGTGSATTEVSTDPRVFERITLGLYREPASAIRELISNAYDADATEVTVTMNPPAFDEITVSDDGNGMSSEAIDYLIHHVGGSLKRSKAGVNAGVAVNLGRSPGGRLLIGQMGIGLYSVARLTRRFKVETKRTGDKYRFVLDIDLSGLDAVQDEDQERFVAGYATVRRESVPETEAEQKKHGTTITLKDVLPDARRILQSVDRWEAYYSKDEHRKKGELKYYIARPAIGEHLALGPEVPWKPEDSKVGKFKALVKSLSTSDEIKASALSLEQTLDYYLAMLWRISLGAPLGYVGKHPFELSDDDKIDFYDLGSTALTPEPLKLEPGQTIGQRLNLNESGAPSKSFKLYVDGIELRRPIVFNTIVKSERKLLDRPKFFVGNFGSVKDGASLGGIGYLFWSYDIAPKENNGLLVRIAGASGILFDRRFLDYRTSENTRLRQISAESFVERGLENAQNVDRESFIDTDPNVRALQRWTHRSLGRVFNRLKKDQKDASTVRKEQQALADAEETEAYSHAVWHEENPGEEPPDVILSARQSAPLGTSEDVIFVGGLVPRIETDVVFSATLRSVMRILDGFGLLENVSEARKARLARALVRVLGGK